MQIALSRHEQQLRIATWIVVASEGLMFAALFAAHGGVYPDPGRTELVLSIAIAAALGGSCLALASAVRHVRSRRASEATRRLNAVLALGATALVLELIAAALFTVRDPLGLIILGLHAAHVATATALAGWATVLTRCGQVHHRGRFVIELVATYCYVIAGLWILVGPLLAT